MAKLTLLFACLILGPFGSTKSASFECKFVTSSSWATLGSVYWCEVQNSVTITSPNAAQIDSISGTHLAGYNNDNVEAFYVFRGQIHYFPRGLDKVFKNLKGIQIVGPGLKEIHQSDLKFFPNLKNLYLYSSNLEILEENLFKFNPNLDSIYLGSNKISHIDPNVFDKLTKLKTLELGFNTCINMRAYGNSTAVQNIIRTVKSQCINSDYSKLEQKVKNLEAESKSLNTEKFKKSFENLENEVKNSKFSDFFQQKLESILEVRAAQIEDAQREAPNKIEKLDEKLTAMSKEISNIKNDVLTVKNAQPANIQKLDKIENLVEDQSQKIATIESKFIIIDGKFVDVNQKIEELGQQITKVDETASKCNNNNTTATSKDVEASSSQSLAAIMNFIENFSKKMEAIENKLAEMDSTQKNVMNKIYKIESDSHNNKVEMNEKFNAILSRI